MSCNYHDEIFEEHFDLHLSRYKINLETYMKGIDFIFVLIRFIRNFVN